MPRPGNIKRDLEILAKLTALKMGVLQRPDSRPARCGLKSAAAIPNSAATRTATGNESLSREPID